MSAAARVILFDGVCLFCSRFVRFVIRRDPRARFRFAPLQSAEGRVLLEQHGLAADDFDTMVLLDGSKAHVRSGAALRIFGALRAPWPLLALFLVVPAPIRDWCYNVCAKRRYRWFGKAEACMVPTAEERERFLAAGV